MLRVGELVLFRLVDGGLRPAICLATDGAGMSQLMVFTNPEAGENRNIGGHSAMDGHTAFVYAVAGDNAGQYTFPQVEEVLDLPSATIEEEPPEEPEAA